MSFTIWVSIENTFLLPKHQMLVVDLLFAVSPNATEANIENAIAVDNATDKIFLHNLSSLDVHKLGFFSLVV
ncbi:hypothetical protein ACFTAO_43800 [Paenibacillus rhizoplanae]